MKHLTYNVVFGRGTLVSGAFAMSLVLLVALGCTCGKMFDLGNVSSNSNSGSSSNNIFGSDDDSGDVDKTLTDATVKATTAKFANAISTEDFSGLYADTASEFQSQYSEAQLKSEFSDFIRQKKQLLPILASAMAMDPTYDSTPSTRTEGSNTILSASGKYQTKPLPITFKYEYVKRSGSWKLLRIEIYVR